LDDGRGFFENAHMRDSAYKQSSGRWNEGARVGLEPIPGNPALEKHYSVGELAKSWGLSANTIRRIFENESGVLEWGTEESRFRRGYKTLRIPESVMLRVHRRLRK
jgi:hypothetical protein